MTKNASLNGSETIAGGTIIIPIDINTAAKARRGCDPAQLTLGIKHEPQRLLLRADSDLELLELEFCNDLITEIGQFGSGDGKITKTKGLDQVLIAIIRQPIGQRPLFKGTILKDLASKKTIVDIILEAESPQAHPQQAAIRDQLRRAVDFSDPCPGAVAKAELLS